MAPDVDDISSQIVCIKYVCLHVDAENNKVARLLFVTRDLVYQYPIELCLPVIIVSPDLPCAASLEAI